MMEVIPITKLQKWIWPRRVLLYTTAVSILGGAVILVALLHPFKDLTGLAMFALMVAIAELGNVELFQTSRNSRVSVSMIIAVASILAIHPLAGVLIQVVSGIINAFSTQVLQAKKGIKNSNTPWFQRFAFNVGMFVLSIAAAGEVFLLAGGTPQFILGLNNILPLLLAVAVDSFVNLSLLLGVISLQTGSPMSAIWRQDFQWNVPINVIGGVIGGGALALAYQMSGPFGAAVFFLPVLTIGYSFHLYADNMRGYVNRLEQLNEDLQDANKGLFETLSAVIDAYDMYTFGHSNQVSIYAAALAKQVGVNEEEQKKIIRAALVHDIGKIGISETIMTKTEPLTDDEVKIIQHHAMIGAEILSRTKGTKDLAPFVRYHHERFDGTGYPERLCGEEIPLGARIITLADCLDAMLSDRPYHKPRQLSLVVAEVLQESGKQFDPRLVRAFLELVAHHGPEFFSNSANLVDQIILPETLEMRAENIHRFLKKSLLHHET